MSWKARMSVIIAMAMFFAPLGMQGGMAMAATPTVDNHAEIATGGHCTDQPSREEKGHAAGKSCCAAMCTAVPAAPPPQVRRLAFTSSRRRPPVDRFHHGFLAELPTPPPRLT